MTPATATASVNTVASTATPTPNIAIVPVHPTTPATQPNPKSATPIITRHIDLNCVVNGGSSIALLRRTAQSEDPQPFVFNLKFFAIASDGRRTPLTNGFGVPTYLRIKSFHESKAGCQIVGTIIKFNPQTSDSMRTGFITNRGYDNFPHEWLTPGNEITFIHRGAGAEGVVFHIVDPKTQRKLALITKPRAKRKPVLITESRAKHLR